MTAPLRGLRVVVTRPRDKAAGLMARLRDEGAVPINFPTIAIADPGSWREVDEAIERLAGGAYGWVVFTSVNAVERFLGRLEPARLGDLKVAAVGPATQEALARRGIFVDVVPEEHSGEALAASIGPGSGTLLLPRVEGATRATVAALEEQGWSVHEVAAYRNVMPDASLRRGAPQEFDAVTFASGSAARNFAALMDVSALGLAAETEGPRLVVCIGPQTAAEASRAGMRVDVVAGTHTDEGLVAALVEHVTRA